MTPRFLPLLMAAAAVSALLPSSGFAAGTLTTLRTFDPASDGNVTYPALVEGADGRLFGVNSAGGRSDNGTIFVINTSGGGFQVLNTFTQTNQGTTPQSGIVQARDGFFYGTTNAGGDNGFGTFYRCDPASGKLTILGSFNNGNPGANPVGAVIEGLDGFLYGTAQFGGGNNFGTVYRTNLATAAITTLATLTGGVGGGLYPQSDLVQATDGNFYGTTNQGGANNLGTFFRVTPAGVYTTLYSFTGYLDGSRPLRGVIQAADGNFYGVTTDGGSGAAGAFYRIAVSGTTATVTALYDFQTTIGDGAEPDGTLIQASDGNFYGTAAKGGFGQAGTIYRVTPTGAYDTLYYFTQGSDGGFPVGGLTQASDGKLYGTTAGINGSAGTIFRYDLGLSAPAPKPTALLTPTANIGDTVLIKGDHFVGTSAVIFAGVNGGTAAATDFTVRSKSVVEVIVPEGAVTGPVTVNANGRTGTTPTSLTVDSPIVLPTVTVVLKQATASKADGTEGRLKIKRSGADKTQPLAVRYKVLGNSTAVFNEDYTLISANTELPKAGPITIPAGKASVTLKITPVRTTAAEPTTTLRLKILPSTAYTVSGSKKVSVAITAPGS